MRISETEYILVNEMFLRKVRITICDIEEAQLKKRYL